MVGEDEVETVDHYSKRSVSTKAKKDDTSMGLALREDELAKIAVERDQNSSLLLGDREDVPVRKAGGMVNRNGAHVVTHPFQCRKGSRVDNLVKKNSHSRVRVPATVGLRVDWPSPSTIW